MNKIIFRIIFLCISIIGFIGELRAEPLVNANILQRVFLIKYGPSSGTAFTIDLNNNQYLITAKHVVSDIKDNDTIEINRNKQWLKLDVNVIRCNDSDIDIVAFPLKNAISPNFPISPTVAGLALSQDVYMVGFPLGQKMEDEQGLNRGFPIPLLKKGIVSSFGHKIIVMDIHNNPGFSGGPIVFFDTKTSELKIAGVVRGFFNDTDGSNSGISYGYHIRYIIDAINAVKK